MVTSNQSVKEAANLMAKQKAGAAIVTEDGEPVGIVTEWDILSRLVAQGKDASKTRVKEIMSSPLTFVSPETKVGDALTLMVRNGHRRLVVRDSHKLLGIITMSQVIGNQKESLHSTSHARTCKRSPVSLLRFHPEVSGGSLQPRGYRACARRNAARNSRNERVGS